MALFRRGASPQPDDAAAPWEDVLPVAGDAAPAHASGPYDADDPAPEGPRVDLGAVRVPGVDGMQLRMEVDQRSGVITGVSVTLDGSVIQLQAFAAPRTEGIWDEIREEIAGSITAQGGTVDDLPGPFGRELLARMPVRTPEGRTGHRPARFIGADGPRWFLRGVITGKAAVEPAAAAALEGVFAQTVVVRGGEARPPRDLLPLRPPGQAPAATPGLEVRPEPEFDPNTRGPEITEIH